MLVQVRVQGSGLSVQRSKMNEEVAWLLGFIQRGLMLSVQCSRLKLFLVEGSQFKVRHQAQSSKSRV